MNNGEVDDVPQRGRPKKDGVMVGMSDVKVGEVDVLGGEEFVCGWGGDADADVNRENLEEYLKLNERASVAGTSVIPQRFPDLISDMKGISGTRGAIDAVPPVSVDPPLDVRELDDGEIASCLSSNNEYLSMGDPHQSYVDHGSEGPFSANPTVSFEPRQECAATDCGGNPAIYSQRCGIGAVASQAGRAQAQYTLGGDSRYGSAIKGGYTQRQQYLEQTVGQRINDPSAFSYGNLPSFQQYAMQQVSHGGRPASADGFIYEADGERPFSEQLSYQDQRRSPPPTEPRMTVGASLGQTLSNAANVPNFDVNPNNPLFQSYSMWVNRKRRRSGPLLWQYINHNGGLMHSAKFSNSAYVNSSKKIYLGTVTSHPIMRNNHQTLPLFLNSVTPTPEFVKVSQEFIKRTQGLNYENVTVIQLKNLMKEFGLCHNGKKSDLILRLKGVIERIRLKWAEQSEAEKRVAPPPPPVKEDDRLGEASQQQKQYRDDEIKEDMSLMYF